jgi:hypothetical protein
MGWVVAPLNAQSADVWTLTLVDFSTQRVTLQSMDERQVRVRNVVSGEQATLAWERLLEFARDSAHNRAAGRSSSALVLLLSNGDRLAGEPVGLIDETLAWSAVGVGEVRVPLHEARAIVRGSTASEDPPNASDQVMLINGDRASGIILSMDAGSLGLSAPDGQALLLPWDAVSEVRFASTMPSESPGSNQPLPPRGFRITLSGDSVVTARSVALSGDSLRLRIGPDEDPRDVPLRAVHAIEQINGPVVWLTSLAPVEVRYHPYFAQVRFPPRFGRSVDGQEIRAPLASGGGVGTSDRPARAGIGVASHSRITWNVPTGFKAFRTHYAIAGNLPYANAVVRVLLDDRVIYEQANVTSATPTGALLVQLENARTLTLEVDYGQTLDVQDRVNWIEPAFVR